MAAVEGFGPATSPESSPPSETPPESDDPSRMMPPQPTMPQAAGADGTELYKALVGEIVKLQKQNGDTQNTIRHLRDVLIQSRSREEYLQQRIQVISDYLCSKHLAGAGASQADIAELTSRLGTIPPAPDLSALQQPPPLDPLPFQNTQPLGGIPASWAQHQHQQQQQQQHHQQQQQVAHPLSAAAQPPTTQSQEVLTMARVHDLAPPFVTDEEFSLPAFPGDGTGLFAQQVASGANHPGMLSPVQGSTMTDAQWELSSEDEVWKNA